MEKLECNLCRFSCTNISDYCSHVSVCPSETENSIFHCPVQNCIKQFNKSSTLKGHCYKAHNHGSLKKVPVKKIADPGTKFDCKYELCLEEFISGRAVYNHTIDHLYNSIKIECPFPDCSLLFKTNSNAVQNFRSHVCKYHKGILNVYLNQNHIASPKTETNISKISEDNVSMRDAAEINSHGTNLVASKIEASNSKKSSDLNISNAVIAGDDENASNAPRAPISSSNAKVLSAAGAGIVHWHLIGQQNLLDSATKMNPEQIELICNLITDQILLRNHNKNLSNFEWTTVADYMGDTYPTHFRDRINSSHPWNSDFIRNKMSQQAEYKTRITRGHKRCILESNLSSNELRKIQKTDEFGCIEWSTLVSPPNESFESLKKKQIEMVILARVAPSFVNFDNVVETMNLCYGILRYNLNRLPQNIYTIKRGWPFMFNTRVGIAHFKRLTGIDSLESVHNFAGSKTVLVFNYMKSHSKKSSTAFLIGKIENESRQAWAYHAGSGEMPIGCKLISVLKALAAFLEEDVMKKLILLKSVR